MTSRRVTVIAGVLAASLAILLMFAVPSDTTARDRSVPSDITVGGDAPPGDQRGAAANPLDEPTARAPPPSGPPSARPTEPRRPATDAAPTTTAAAPPSTTEESALTPVPPDAPAVTEHQEQPGPTPPPEGTEEAPSDETAPPLPPDATVSGCPPTLRQRDHADGHYVANHLDAGFPPLMPRRVVCAGGSVQFVVNLSAVHPGFGAVPSSPLPVMASGADYASGTDFVTVEAAATLFSHGKFVSSGIAVNVKTGFVIDRSIARAVSGVHTGTPVDVPLVGANVRRMYHMLRGGRGGTGGFVEELPDTPDGYLWCGAWFVARDDLLLADLINTFAAHWELQRATRRNATLMMPNVRHHAPFPEWLAFLQRHYGVKIMHLPPVARTVYKGKITFAAPAESGFSAAAARFVGEVLAPRVLEWCTRDGNACEAAPFPFAAMGRGRSVLPEESFAAKAAISRRNITRITLPTSSSVSMEQRVFQAVTADVRFLQWGEAASIERVLMGAFVAVEKLPWKPAQVALINQRSSQRLGNSCPKPRPPPRVVLLAAGAGSAGVKEEVFSRSGLFGHAADPQATTWYIAGEDLATQQMPGAVVKACWLGDDGDSWPAQALDFDDGAFNLAKESLAIVDGGKTAAAAEIRDDLELLDHLVRTSRVFVFNQWVAQAPRALPAKPSADGLRPFPDPSAGASLMLPPAALYASTVKGAGPASAESVAAWRTYGTARFLLTARVEAFAQARVPTASSGWVLAAYYKSFGGVVVAEQPDKSVVVPNSHPCFGIADELKLGGQTCPAVAAVVAADWGSMKSSAADGDAAGATVAVWLVPAGQPAKMGAGVVVQAILARLGHLVIDGTLADRSGSALAAILPEDLAEGAAQAARQLLELFGVTQVVAVKHGAPLRFKTTKVLVPPILEDFRMQFSAHQFAATRWLAANSEKAKQQGRHRRKVVLALRNDSDAGYVNETAGMDVPGVSMLVDPSVGDALRSVQHARTLVVFYGDALLYFVSLWADALRSEPGPQLLGESGRRRHLNVIVLCPPAVHARCRLGPDGTGTRSRYYSLGRELNLPRGVHVAYQLVTDPDGEYAAPTQPMPLHQLLTGGHLNNFGDGLPSNHTSFGVGSSGSQDQARQRMLKRGFRESLKLPL
uniref:Uncharacterized protein n=3 Tax=Neobodo designis TaxID=312471 RepID=A0A7S1PME2_NEODS|mmetsp:Transcript_12323/g.38337  ORF Transcript_12323/g.38337 Transcript_12323/m.38337 type:complete len:1139 (+) Transcript_12323:92-3508(+)